MSDATQTRGRTTSGGARWSGSCWWASQSGTFGRHNVSAGPPTAIDQLPRKLSAATEY